jgi:hypothetical protein
VVSISFKRDQLPGKEYIEVKGTHIAVHTSYSSTAEKLTQLWDEHEEASQMLRASVIPQTGAESKPRLIL